MLVVPSLYWGRSAYKTAAIVVAVSGPVRAATQVRPPARPAALPPGPGRLFAVPELFLAVAEACNGATRVNLELALWGRASQAARDAACCDEVATLLRLPEGEFSAKELLPSPQQVRAEVRALFLRRLQRPRHPLAFAPSLDPARLGLPVRAALALVRVEEVLERVVRAEAWLGPRVTVTSVAVPLACLFGGHYLALVDAGCKGERTPAPLLLVSGLAAAVPSLAAFVALVELNASGPSHWQERLLCWENLRQRQVPALLRKSREGAKTWPAGPP